MADIFITKPGSMFCVEEAVYSFLNLYSLSDISVTAYLGRGLG